MSTSPPADRSSSGSPTRASSGFAVGARLHVFLLFMTQFMIILAVGGGVIPALHERGVSTVVLVIGAILGLVAVHLAIAAAGRLLPVRCRGCGGRSYFLGFGWWPFIYRYPCSTCGQVTRLEVTG